MENEQEAPIETLSIFHHMTIDARLEQVWKVFGDPGCPWFSRGGAVYENRLGGFLSHPELKMRAEVTHFAIGRRVVWQLYVDDNLGTTVEYQFAWDGENTHVSFREDGWEQVPEEDRDEYFKQSKQSWLQMLANLKSCAENPDFSEDETIDASLDDAAEEGTGDDSEAESGGSDADADADAEEDPKADGDAASTDEQTSDAEEGDAEEAGAESSKEA